MNRSVPMFLMAGGRGCNRERQADREKCENKNGINFKFVQETSILCIFTTTICGIIPSILTVVCIFFLPMEEYDEIIKTEKADKKVIQTREKETLYIITFCPVSKKERFLKRIKD